MMNAKTGRNMVLKDHVQQSINDILWTRYGTRIQREQYGSLLPDMIDMPMTEDNRLRIASACIMALGTWEPRLTIQNIHVLYQHGEQTGFEIAISGKLNDRSEDFLIKGSQ